MSKKTIIKPKDILKKYWDKKFPVNIIRIAEKLGIRIFLKSEINKEELYVIETIGKEKHIIIYNGIEDQQHINLLVAQGIAEIVLGYKYIKCQNSSLAERVHFDFFHPTNMLINVYATELLIPQKGLDMLIKMFQQTHKNSTMRDIFDYCNVPAPVVIFSMFLYQYETMDIYRLSPTRLESLPWRWFNV